MRAFSGSAFLAAQPASETLSPQVSQLDASHPLGPSSRSQSLLEDSTTEVAADTDSPLTLDASNYGSLWANALKVECDALRLECEEHALFRVPLVKASVAKDLRPSMYRCVSCIHNSRLKNLLTVPTVSLCAFSVLFSSAA